ncbi:TPA: hypothetical protein EYG84_03015 [Candidatus Gracilibacteria bacterium]|nr:hypothetical protein [Candidatus Gracilibacteria bacterium]
MQILVCVTLALFFSSVGFFIGIYDEQNQHKFFEIIPDSSHNNADMCKIPVISINQIENGILHISKNDRSEIRIMVNNNIKTLQVLDVKSKNIKIDAVTILPKIEKIPAPQWANFVASKRGTTFWALDNPRAFILTPKNRIFFKTKDEALKKKYKDGLQKEKSVNK